MNTEKPLPKEKPKGQSTARVHKGALKTLSPIVIWMISFFVVPFILMILVSFFTRGQYGDITYKVTGENYKRIVNPLYFKIMGDSLVISFLTTFLCLLFAYPFAYFIAKTSKKMRAILLMMIILPFWTNSLVRTYAWIILLRSEGIINSYLMKLGIISHPLTLLYNNTAVLIGMVYMMFPFMVLPLYATIEKLDHSLAEAAYDLGASPRKVFFKITLPLTASGIFAGCLLVFVPTLGYFFIPDLLGGSKIMLVSNLIKNQFLTARDWPFGSAISVILIIIMFILIGVYVRLGGTKNKTEVF